MFKVRILFTKNDESSYISHLDLMKALQRSFCRAKLPVKYSEGFNPHICMSILSPLSTGYSSDYELCDLELLCDGIPDNAVDRLNDALPHGIRVLKVYPANDSMPVSAIAYSCFSVIMEGGDAERFSRIFSEPIFIDKRSKRGSKQINMLDYIKQISFEKTKTGVECKCILTAGADPLNPSYIVSFLRENGFLDPEGTVKYRRISVLDINGQLFC